MNSATGLTEHLKQDRSGVTGRTEDRNNRMGQEIQVGKFHRGGAGQDNNDRSRGKDSQGRKVKTGQTRKGY
jgi:hypothetical protein